MLVVTVDLFIGWSAKQWRAGTMQFNIRTLLGVTAAVAVLCGVIFAAPPIVAAPILIGLLWISPSLWINGIIYGRGGWRPFFIGGTMAGLVPHCGSLYTSVALVAEMLERGNWEELFVSDRSQNLYVALTFLAPGPFAIIGGLVGVWTWWLFQPVRATPQVDDRANGTAAEEYMIVSGRLKAERAMHSS
jgi:hypothetical protein